MKATLNSIFRSEIPSLLQSKLAQLDPSSKLNQKDNGGIFSLLLTWLLINSLGTISIALPAHTLPIPRIKLKASQTLNCPLCNSRNIKLERNIQQSMRAKIWRWRATTQVIRSQPVSWCTNFFTSTKEIAIGGARSCVGVPQGKFLLFWLDTKTLLISYKVRRKWSRLPWPTPPTFLWTAMVS